MSTKPTTTRNQRPAARQTTARARAGEPAAVTAVTASVSSEEVAAAMQTVEDWLAELVLTNELADDRDARLMALQAIDRGHSNGGAGAQAWRLLRGYGSRHAATPEALLVAVHRLATTTALPHSSQAIVRESAPVAPAPNLAVTRGLLLKQVSGRLKGLYGDMAEKATRREEHDTELLAWLSTVQAVLADIDACA